MSVYPLNKKFIVCEGLKVRLNLVSSFSFWFIFPPNESWPLGLSLRSTSYDAVCFRKLKVVIFV